MLAGLGCDECIDDLCRVLRVKLGWDELSRDGVGRARQEGAVSMITRHCHLCRMVPAPVCGVGSSQQQLPVLVACVLGGGCETREADPVCPIPFLLYDSS